MDLIKNTKAYIQEHDLIRPGDIVLAAVSGGMDSIALAYILISLRQELKFNLAIANFNHQLRPEAEEEARFVADFAKENQITYFLGGADIASLANKGNLQEIARQQRYAYLRKVASKLQADSIAVAHHSNDQAETVLMHILRGSGLSGIAAMSPGKNDLIRPLLFASRADIAEFVALHNLPYREDASNASTKYLRNKIRHQLMPTLEEYNPNIQDTLTSTADICRAEDELLDDLAENSLAELWLNETSALEKQGFDQLPRALQRRVVRKAYTMIMGEKKELNFAQVEAVLRLRDEQSTELPGGMKAYLRQDICFAKVKPPLPDDELSYQLIADGSWQRISDWGWEYQVVKESSMHEAVGMQRMLIPQEMLAHLYWRTRRDGDAVVSTGKRGKRKLKEIFIDNRIPAFQRKKWPLLIYDESIIWIGGLWKKDIEASDKHILIKIRRYDKI